MILLSVRFCSQTKMEPLKFCLILITLPVIEGAIPGTFFWKPRLGIDLSIPTTETDAKASLPTKENVRKGVVVLIDGYQAGMTIVALAAGMCDANPYPHLNPTRAYFYTNAYRWALRHFSLVPLWLEGNKGSYGATHKVWKKRYTYMDEFVPTWLQHLVPFTKEKDWLDEELQYKRFQKVAAFTFAKHNRFPRKKFRDFKEYEESESSKQEESSSSN